LIPTVKQLVGEREQLQTQNCAVKKIGGADKSANELHLGK
jgi:hypothetical protein